MAIWILFRSLRLRYFAQIPETNPYGSPGRERYLYCVWHDSMVIPTFAGKHRCTTALTSRHADGSFVAHVLQFNHIEAIRGSTNRITAGALRELIKRAGRQHIVITPDGPRGPNRCMSTGIAFLASRTGRAIIPTAYACSSYWRFRGNWSDLIIPKPFAKVVLRAGKPIYISPDLTSDQLQPHVERIQTAMDELHAVAQSQVQRGSPSGADAGILQRKKQE